MQHSLHFKIAIFLLLLISGWQCKYEEIDPLYAEFSVQGGNAQALAPVTFINTSVGAKTWAWNFGNGQSSNLQSPPPQTYPAQGTYTVSLTVTNGAGASDTKTINLSVGPPPPLQLNCSNAVVNGSLVQGQPANVTVSVPYTGGNGGSHSGQTVNSTGVSGLIATLSAGSFNNGTGNLTYQLSGTPSNSGTAVFAINLSGQSCNISINVNNPPSGPTVAAPTPSYSAANVISVFSDAYTNIAGTNLNPIWGQATQVSQVPIAGNNTLVYTGLNYQGLQLGSNQNLSTFTHLHLDFWSVNSTSLQVFLISPGPAEMPVTLSVPTSGWNSVDIPLSAFSALVNLSNVFQFKFEGNGNIYLDNILFYK